jgi:hypothetical protein
LPDLGLGGPERLDGRCGEARNWWRCSLVPESQTCFNQIWILATPTCSSVPKQIAKKSIR